MVVMIPYVEFFRTAKLSKRIRLGEAILPLILGHIPRLGELLNSPKPFIWSVPLTG